MKRVHLPASIAAVAPRAGNYFCPISQNAAATLNTLGVGTLRVAPFLLRQSVSLTRLAGDIATVGEAGSKLRIGIWSDDGNTYPGALVVDAGQIAGDSATVQELTISVALAAGIYWLGGAVQNVTTTQPTVRILDNDMHPPVPVPFGTTLPAANASAVGLQVPGVTGAFASTFPAGATVTASVPRLYAKAA